MISDGKYSADGHNCKGQSPAFHQDGSTNFLQIWKACPLKCLPAEQSP
ncbi:hypothetical protein RchiOBHm_Chr7g0212681 [Rosa chinensis]|uniref:Uncharacterized protein n=1 Tax=Rosa chinensis TaxID=74649 RepID=A0A2P6PAU3_ROSCH|nr:hypothetical protein RchiOBHm_Chr7g0212681 [Rosa chinensis]